MTTERSISIERTQICCLCDRPFVEYGNNATPLKNGRCCNRCNDEHVIPERIRRMRAQPITEGE